MMRSHSVVGVVVAVTVAVAVVAVVAVGCGSSSSGSPTDAVMPDTEETGSCSDQLSSLEAEMSAKLDVAAVDPNVTTDPDFTVMLERADGRRFVHSHGVSTETTRYESASTSKWVTATIILDLVDQGHLTLDSTAHDLMPAYWLETKIKLRDLLSFTSGFAEEPPCVNLASATFAGCVHTIYDNNSASAPAPAMEYEYAPTHLQIAGAMAIAASNKTNWAQVFAAWQTRTGLFPTAAYDIPSTTNPRIAGGMHWTGSEYMGFLRALFAGELLTPTTMAAMHANQRGTATVVYSPIWNEIHEDWSYGFGNWVECPTASVEGGFNCSGLHRNSSAGAYGAYPFIDFDHDYFGLVARQGDVMSAGEGIAIFRSIETLATQWADHNCDGARR